MTPGNAAQADPVEERGAPLYRIVLEKHGGGIETRKRVNETGANSQAGEKQSGDGIHLAELSVSTIFDGAVITLFDGT
jgi:hypothetical protein